MYIDHVAMYVSDLEGSKQFFERYFGAKSSNSYHNPKTGLRTYFLTFDEGCRLELMQKPGVAAGTGSAETLGYTHLAFSVGGAAAVDALTQRLTAEGWPLLSGPRTTGDGYYESCVAGPEGCRIEIVA